MPVNLTENGQENGFILCKLEHPGVREEVALAGFGCDLHPLILLGCKI